MRSIEPLLAVSLERASDEFRSTFSFMGIFSERRWKIQTYQIDIISNYKLNSLWKHVGLCRQCSFSPKIYQTCWCDRPWKDRKKKSSFPFRGPTGAFPWPMAIPMVYCWYSGVATLKFFNFYQVFPLVETVEPPHLSLPLIPFSFVIPPSREKNTAGPPTSPSLTLSILKVIHTTFHHSQLILKVFHF